MGDERRDSGVEALQDRLSRAEGELERTKAALEREEHRWQALIEQGSDVLIVLDPDGRLRWTGPASERVLGYPSGAMVGAPIVDLTHPDDRVILRDAFEKLRDHPGSKVPVQVRVAHAEGGWRDVEATAVNLGDEPTVGGIVVNFRDVTDRKLAEAALRQSEQSFRLLFARNPQPMWVFEPESLRFLEVNDAAVAHYGYSRDQFLGMTLADIIPSDNVDDFMRKVTEAGTDFQPGSSQRHQLASGRVIDVELSSDRLDFAGRPAVLTAVKDVTMQRALERELRHQALHDPLTRLPNRALLVDRIQRSLSRLDRHAGAVAAIFLDLDRFKVINDSLGHDVGDWVLTEAAARLRGAIRQEDTVARFGGDEFVICAEVIDAEEAVGIGSRALDSLISPFRTGSQEMVLTASVGVSVTSTATGSPETLLRDADWAMYRAKEQGGNRLELFDRGLRSRLLVRMEVERSLRRALGTDEMKVLYQPIISVPDGRVVGAEALVRWFHPKRGMIGPGEFIPVAEETGIIGPLGAWVFEEACRQWVAWRRRSVRREPINLAINVSARQLTVPSTFDTFYEILSRTGADPAHVSLEITESVLMEGNDSILEAMLALKWLGVRLNLDDFGTRYSSLSYLRRLPFDTLKVDQSFVSGLREDSRDQAIVRSVVELAHALGLDVVAEGVETPEQLALLSEMGADRAQGYLLGRPVMADDFPFDNLVLSGSGPAPGDS